MLLSSQAHYLIHVSCHIKGCLRCCASKCLTLARRLGFDQPHCDAKMSCGDDLSTDISSPSDSSLAISDGVGMIVQCSLRTPSTLFSSFSFSWLKAFETEPRT